jgi:hypothetical protein
MLWPAAAFVLATALAAGCSGGLRVGTYEDAAVDAAGPALDAAIDVAAPDDEAAPSDVAGEDALVPGAARLALTPTVAHFGPVALGQTTDELRFLVTNEGSAASDVIGVLVAPKPFAVVSNDCSENRLAPGGFCAVGVSLTPAARGPLSGTLTVTGDPGGPVVATLTGGANDLAASPSAVELGCVMAPNPTASTTIAIRNDGAKDTDPLMASVSGEGFAIVSRTCDKPLNPGASCSVSVSVVIGPATICTPGCLHVYRASLTIGDGTSKVSVSLSAAVAACT